MGPFVRASHFGYAFLTHSHMGCFSESVMDPSSGVHDWFLLAIQKENPDFEKRCSGQTLNIGARVREERLTVCIEFSCERLLECIGSVQHAQLEHPKMISMSALRFRWRGRAAQMRRSGCSERHRHVGLLCSLFFSHFLAGKRAESEPDSSICLRLGFSFFRCWF